MLPALVEVSRIVHEGDQVVVHAWSKGVADAWRASGRYDGLWMWLDESYDPPELSVWAPAEPIAAAVRPGSVGPSREDEDG